MTTLGACLALAGCASLPGIYERPKPMPVAAAPADVPAPGASAGGPAVPGPEAAPAVAELGKVAPDIAFTAIGGQARRLSEFRGKYIALVFFAHW